MAMIIIMVFDTFNEITHFWTTNIFGKQIFLCFPVVSIVVHRFACSLCFTWLYIRFSWNLAQTTLIMTIPNQICSWSFQYHQGSSRAHCYVFIKLGPRMNIPNQICLWSFQCDLGSFKYRSLNFQETFWNNWASAPLVLLFIETFDLSYTYCI